MIEDGWMGGWTLAGHMVHLTVRSGSLEYDVEGTTRGPTSSHNSTKGHSKGRSEILEQNL